MKWVIIGLVIILSFLNLAFAKCNFKSSDHIDKLSNPSSITSIDIKIIKHKKFFKDSFGMLLLSTSAIPQEFKKPFKASIKVHYQFGSCEYSARIRQSGVAKDHVRLDKNKVLRSLDVKLKDGNIINATRFKLFLPETRNGRNEILASLILKKIGFISPETFEVKTNVNGQSSIMLFQETAEKELLEKRSRREGVIFEGEQKLIWDPKNWGLFELKNLSLSRVDNISWFKKGSTSQKITLKAYSKLQESYLKSKVSEEMSDLAIFPNELRNKIFVNYNYVLLAMNGAHGLELYNRKYYFNSIESNFEPIYYDGNVSFDKVFLWKKEYRYLFPILPSQNFLDELNSLSLDNNLFEEFSQRILIQRDNAKKLFFNNLNQFRDNLKILQAALKDINNQIKLTDTSFVNQIHLFEKFQKEKKLDQIIIRKINFEKKKYKAYSSSNNQYELTPDEMADLISENIISGKRAVYLVHSKLIPPIKEKPLISNNLPGLIKISNGIKADLNFEKKIIKFIQTKQNDWVLLSEGDFSGWQISFDSSIKNREFYKNSEQRFNDIGLTGCLTVYKAKINKTTFSVSGGDCEDSINIINSEGRDVHFYISNAFADAIDLDFSNLAITSLKVETAGNDCLDVSWGNYSVKEVFLERCGDKGISVGEKSILSADNISIKESMIGLAVKDQSILSVMKLQTNDVVFCGQAYQKKQEFGGAILAIQKSNCSTNVEVDQNSKYIKNLQ